MIAKKDLKDKLEPFIYEKLKKESYEVIKIDPIKLLTWNRLDLAFRLFFLENKNSKIGEELYTHVISAQTFNTFNEQGNEHKFSSREFIKYFNHTYEDIKKNGFDKKRTLIPLSNSNTILNGAHRIASSLHLGLDVFCIRTELPDMISDYKYLYEMNVPEIILDTAVIQFLDYAENTYIGFLWPSGNKNKELAESKFSNVIYKKEIILNRNGSFNLLYELYKHMDWVGNENNGFRGIQQKLIECFPELIPFTVVVFQADNIESVREIKENIRQINNIGYSSIHITDTKEEAIRISRLIFNQNGMHFLNYANPTKSKKLYSQLSQFHEFVDENKINKKDIILDASILLSLYGLREANDVDYILKDGVKVTIPYNNIENHDDELQYYSKSKSTLINDPKNYFYFRGLKFVGYESLYSMKKKRNQIKDIHDIELMRSLVKGTNYQKIKARLKQKILFFKIKTLHNIKNRIIEALKFFKLYSIVKKIYKIFVRSKYNGN
jgi:hypothetical protein